MHVIIKNTYDITNMIIYLQIQFIVTSSLHNLQYPTSQPNRCECFITKQMSCYFYSIRIPYISQVIIIQCNVFSWQFTILSLSISYATITTTYRGNSVHYIINIYHVYHVSLQNKMIWINIVTTFYRQCQNISLYSFPSFVEMNCNNRQV